MLQIDLQSLTVDEAVHEDTFVVEAVVVVVGSVFVDESSDTILSPSSPPLSLSSSPLFPLSFSLYPSPPPPPELLVSLTGGELHPPKETPKILMQGRRKDGSCGKPGNLYCTFGRVGGL